MMKSRITSSVLLTAWIFSLLQTVYTASISGVLAPGSGDDTAKEIYATAGRTPNATSSLRFTRNDFNNEQTWLWTVNITDVPVPNRIYDLGDPTANSSENLHVINTEFQLAILEDAYEGLQPFLESINSTLYFEALQIGYGRGVVEGYSNQTNETCASLFGEKCAQSLMEAAADLGGNSFDTSDLEGCGTFDKGDGFGGTGTGVDPTSNGTQPVLGPYDSLYYDTSDTFTAGNQTTYEQRESAVNILFLNIVTEPRTEGTGSPDGPSVLCQVVNKDAASAAVSWRQKSVAGFWSLGLLGLVVILFQ